MEGLGLHARQAEGFAFPDAVLTHGADDEVFDGGLLTVRHDKICAADGCTDAK